MTALAQVATVAAWCASLMFLAAYSVMARWWRSSEGQNIALGALWIVVLASIGFLRRVGVDPMVVDFLAALAWAGVALTFVWRTGLVLRAQGFLGQHRRPDPHDEK